MKDLVIIGDHFEYYTDADLKEFEEYPDCRYLSQRSFEDEGIAWRWKEDGSEIAMTSVDLGVLEYLPNLNRLNMAMVELENILDHLGLEQTRVKSIVGIQNLRNLRNLNICGTDVDDLSPLSDCDFSYAYEQGGISLFLDRLPCEDFSPLSGLKEIENLSLNEIPSDLWLEDLSDMHIRALEAVKGFDKKEDLEKLVEEHPELEELLLSWSDNLKDLTPLLSLEHLQHVRVSADMEEAIESLGEDYGFELEIEG